MRTLGILAAALLTVLSFSITSQAAQAKGAQDRLLIALPGSAVYPEVAGKAKFSPSRRELEVDVEGALRLLDQTLDVYVDGALAGSMLVVPDRNLAGVIIDGVASLDLSAQLGQIVPPIGDGSLVEVKLGIDLVASGTF